MKQQSCFRIFLLLTVLSAMSATRAQTVLLDDFNRVNSNTVGAGWTETETVAGTGAMISSNQLRMGSATAGRDFVTRDVSAAYNTVFNTNSGVLTWAFNMRQSRTDPSGFDNSNYGVAFIIGGTSANFLTGNGYAVLLGNSGTSDNLRLVRYTNGLSLNSGITNIIAPAVDYGSEYLTVKVTYNPVGNNWSLYVGSNLAAFTDPSTATYTQLGATTSDATYTGNDLLYLGCLWNHATSTTDFGDFDNIRIPNLCTPVNEPTTQSSGLTFTAIGANSANLNWIRGNGTGCIVIARAGSAVTAVPADGATYNASSQFGAGSMIAPGEYVIYSGSGSSMTLTGLTPLTNYQFSVFEYNGSGCIINFLTTAAATGSMNTISCIIAAAPSVQATNPTIVSGLSNSIQVAWTRGTGDYCIVICKSGSAVTGIPVDGSGYTANSIFGTGSTIAAGEYVVYNGTGNTITVTGLPPNSTFYFAVFEMNSLGCNSNYLTTSPALISGATSPVASYNRYFGNLHSHSDYSDGDMDNVCNGNGSANCCFDIGNTAMNFDFMGISDHNHNEGPIMTPAKYASGIIEASSYTAGHTGFAALYGMEWGTISTGGHVAIYGINQLVGWNTGNYDVYCAKGDYASLFGLVNATPNAYATLCHPNATDFGSLSSSPYNAVFDNAIVGVAVKNGPYNSLNTSYTDPAAGNNINYFKTLLAKGYHLGPTVDLDNHNSATMGKSSEGRTVVLATTLTPSSINDAMLNMRFYASEDFNVNISYTVNGIFQMGNITSQNTAPSFNVTVSDPDGETTATIRLWYGVPGSGVAATVLASASGSPTLNFTHNISAGSYYYFAEIIQADGNTAWTSPVWYTRLSTPLPISLINFSGHNTTGGIQLKWTTASETNNDYFTLSRGDDPNHFSPIAIVDGSGTSSVAKDYSYLDREAGNGIHYYKLDQTDFDGRSTYCSTIRVSCGYTDEPVRIFPNPSSGAFYAGPFRDVEEVQVTLNDIAGKNIPIDFHFADGYISIEKNNLAEGTYFLKVTHGADVYCDRVLIRNRDQ